MATNANSRPDVARITLAVLGIGLLIAGSLWVLKPFIPALLWAVMIVVATWPLMLAVQARLGGRRSAVAVMTLGLLLVLIVPTSLAVWTILGQSDRISDLVRSVPSIRIPPPPSWVREMPLGGRLAGRWAEYAALSSEELANLLSPYVRSAGRWFAAQAGGFGVTIVQFLLTVVLSAILYARGEGAAQQVRRFIRRLTGPRADEIVTLSGQAIRAVALGIVVTAVVQATLAGIGLFGVGFPFAGMFVALVFILCVAQLGPIIALLPCVIWLYAAGSTGRATVLLVVMILAGTVDNVLRPLLIKKGADLPLLLIFAGVIGGLLWLGIIGLFVGPVILAVASRLLDGWIESGTGEHAPEPAVAAAQPGATGPSGAPGGPGGGVSPAA